MMDFKGDPGPWVIMEALENSALGVIAEGCLKPNGERSDFVCLVSPMADLTPCDEANARLISAAPDLLKALQNSLPWLDRIGSESVYSEAKTAIEKAFNIKP